MIALPVWAIYTMVAAAVVSAGAAYMSGQQQGKIADYNAALAQRQAQEKRQQAEYAAQRQEEQNAQLRAKQRLAFNTSGVAMEGTPTDVLLKTQEQLELDRRAILYGGQSAGTALETQANLARMQGRSAESAGSWSAASSLLSGATRLQQAYKQKTDYGISGNAS